MWYGISNFYNKFIPYSRGKAPLPLVGNGARLRDEIRMANSAANWLPPTLFRAKIPLPAVRRDPTHAIDIKRRLTIAATFLQNEKRIFPDLREWGPAQSRSNPAPALGAGRRVLGQEFLDAGLGRGQRRPGLPLRDELAIRGQFREFLGDRIGVRLVVAR
jgi:hypothetical protein